MDTDSPKAAWLPSSEVIATANISHFMRELNMSDVKSFHHWTITNYCDFWLRVVRKLNIVFRTDPIALVSLTQGVESPLWFPGAKLNISDSCFTASPSAIAITYTDTDNNICTLTYDELRRLSNRIANSLVKQGFVVGDAIAISMPMNPYAVAIYLGIIKMGGVVVSIADSFSSDEIDARLRIANVTTIFTQDFYYWGGKKILLPEKMKQTRAKKIIVVPYTTTTHSAKNENDVELHWNDFLIGDDHFTAVPCDPMTPCHILFSSGTTGQPKAIIWNHTTPIKAASDAFFHHNIKPTDVFAWPTNLGWMMGPWLVFATLINHASLALFTEAPKDRAFGQFIQQAKVTILGVVPTLVAIWKQTKCMEQLDWNAIKVFSSTGECSNPQDMLYLMALAGGKPVIEYCGGTEIGGAYLSSTVVEDNYPSLFSTPTMGLHICIIDEEGNATTSGEVSIIPPSIGLSTQLLNADHHDVYFAAMPKASDGSLLRRHGDQVKQLANGYYCVLGRVDDTMKLGGIKTSAAEIERVLVGTPSIIEIAAIAIQPPDNGPSHLIIYAETTEKLDKQAVMKTFQKKINTQLNPLFKIHDVIFINELPKTASNKIMRRVLRKKYVEDHS